MNQPLTKALAIEARLNTDVANTTAMTAGGGLVIENVMQAMEIAKLMAISGLAVRKHVRDNPGMCFGIVIQSMDWGMSPYAVANKSYAVNDQLAYESQLIQAVILRRAPIKGRFRFTYEGEGPTRRCTAAVTTTDGETVEYRSPMFSEIKIKNSPLWQSDMDQQFSYFAGRGLCRRHFPDVLLGIYDPDELEGGDRLKDVTPKASGMVERLAGKAGQGGFDPAGVTAALEESSLDWSNAEAAITYLEQGHLPDGFSIVDGVLILPADAAPELRGHSVVMAHFDEIRAADGTVIKSKDGPTETAGPEHDPEIQRAGTQAAVDGEERRAPEGLSPADCMAWLSGYDAIANGAR